MTAGTDGARPDRGRWKRLWPLAVIAAALAAFYGFGLNDLVAFDRVARQRALLQAWVAGQGTGAAAMFAMAYAASVVFSLPVGAVLTILAGFLFGQVMGTAVAVIGAGTGAAGFFLLVRYALAGLVTARFAARIEPLRRGFQAEALSYLITLRLIPVAPFWLVNIAAAVMEVRLVHFMAATYLGIIPGSAVFVGVGRGLDSLFAACDALRAAEPLAVCHAPSPADIFTADILLAFGGLATLALLPVLWHRWRGRRTDPGRREGEQ